jgi:hypothetical protein
LIFSNDMSILVFLTCFESIQVFEDNLGDVYY